MSYINAADPPLNIKEMSYMTCSTSGCHFRIKNNVSVHGPVKAKGCYICHAPILGTHKFKLTDQVPSLCLDCHDNMAPVKVPEQDQKQHSAHKLDIKVAESLGIKETLVCTHCHNPHSSSLPKLIREKILRGKKEVCMSCHKIPKDHPHPLVDERCVSCHSFHQGRWKTPLMLDKNKSYDALCFDCHRNKKKDISCQQCHEKNKLKTVPHIPPFMQHEEILFSLVEEVQPGKFRCDICHEAHGPKRSHLEHRLKDPAIIVQFCSTCHGEDAQDLHRTFHQHQPKEVKHDAD